MVRRESPGISEIRWPFAVFARFALKYLGRIAMSALRLPDLTFRPKGLPAEGNPGISSAHPEQCRLTAKNAKDAKKLPNFISLTRNHRAERPERFRF